VVQRVSALPGIGLNELADDLNAFGAREVSEGLALGFNAEP
jgi:hypothetical protein